MHLLKGCVAGFSHLMKGCLLAHVVGLSFELKSGTNILVTGDSGCGKSSLLRVLHGLWPHSTGELLLSTGELVTISRAGYN